MYKYMSAEVAPKFTSTLRVRFTQPSALNDPFELRPLIDFEGTAKELHDVVDAKIKESFSTADQALAFMEQLEATDRKFPKNIVPIRLARTIIAANPELSQKIMSEMERHRSDVMAELMTAKRWEAAWDRIYESFGQSIGIFSLTEDPAHPVMWSHYAGQHFGIVVEFDETHSWFNEKVTPIDELRHLQRVAYIENPHPRTLTQLNGIDVLYTKNAHWAYEREWRIIRALKDGVEVSPGIICFDVPPNAIRSIIFGCRTTSTLEHEIRTSVAANSALSHICFNRAKLSGAKLEIVDATL